MAEKAIERELVDVVVMRSSYWLLEKDGSRREVKANMGDDSKIKVPRSHLDAFKGILVAVSDADAEAELVKSESMQQVTSTEEAVAPIPAQQRRSNR